MRKGVAVGLLAVAVAAALAVGGCANNAQTGALAGGALGAVAGQAIGHNTGGTLIGAAAGAGGGYIVGNEMDKSKTNQDMAAQRDANNTAIVNVHNSNGSISSVMLRRNGNMWVGPNGEQYTSLPTEDQLRSFGYGR